MKISLVDVSGTIEGALAAPGGTGAGAAGRAGGVLTIILRGRSEPAPAIPITFSQSRRLKKELMSNPVDGGGREQTADSRQQELRTGQETGNRGQETGNRNCTPMKSSLSHPRGSGDPCYSTKHGFPLSRE
jgi:hypothetical protein